MAALRGLRDPMEDWQKVYVVIAAVVILAAIALGLSYLSTYLQARESGGLLTARSIVVEPSGHELANETVTVHRATPLAVLNASGTAHGFPVTVTGSPDGTQYVTAINGTADQGDHAWTFRVYRGHQWCWGIDAPNKYQLVNGDTVLWAYVNTSRVTPGC